MGTSLVSGELLPELSPKSILKSNIESLHALLGTLDIMRVMSTSNKVGGAPWVGKNDFLSVYKTFSFRNALSTFSKKKNGHVMSEFSSPQVCRAELHPDCTHTAICKTHSLAIA